MKGINRLYVLAIFVMVSLACSLTSQASSNVPEGLTSRTSIPSVQSNQPCQADLWEITPIGIRIETGYDQVWGGTPLPENGWNYVFVFFAVENNSDFWGKTRLNASDFSITTEGGFSYQAQTLNVWFPEDISLPNSKLRSSITVGGGLSFEPTRWITTEYLPPKFSTRGDVIGYTTKIFGAVEGWSVAPYNFLFKVAATQNELTLNMSGVTVDCIIQDNKMEGSIPSYSIDLGKIENNVIFPTGLSVDKLPNLDNSTIDVQDFGTINITSVQLDSGNATVKFRFTNANAGENAAGQVTAYIIGNDGYVHSMAGGNFSAGPGQTTDEIFLSTMGGIPDTDSNLKIIFEIRSNQGAESYQVFNLNT
jgi:hypothetical protein